jgi:hypothetical protein
MKKLCLCIVCALWIVWLPSCHTAEKVGLPTDDTSASALPTGKISDRVQDFPEWCVDGLLPENCGDIKILSNTDDRYVLLAQADNLSLNEIIALYRAISQGKEGVSETKANDYYIISWQESGVEIYIKAVQGENDGITITVDFYNGSRNE